MNKAPLIVLTLALVMSGCGGSGGGDGIGGMGGMSGVGGMAGAGGQSGAGGSAGAAGRGGAGGSAGAAGEGGVGGSAGAAGEGGAGGSAGAGGQGGTGGMAGAGGRGGEGGGTAGTGGMPENQCPFYTSVLVSPLSQSVGNLIDVDTRVLDLDGDAVDVLVTSDCGEVADPLQTADADTGESSTAVRCDRAESCAVTVSISDDEFHPEGCDGTNVEATTTTTVQCQPALR